MAIALNVGIGGPDKVWDDNFFEDNQLDSVVVSAGRAYNSTPVAHTTVLAGELAKAAPASSLPMTLKMQPSVVVTNEGGTGVGNSAIKVRGVPGNQTIVTLNGITLNDAETQEVFWVNIPALSRYVGSLQLQRGLGTTASGPGAFGASINMVTDVPAIAGGGVEAAGGLFGTFAGFAHASTGATPIGLFAEAAGSWQRTDGYIRNGFANVWSACGSFGWQGVRDLVRLPSCTAASVPEYAGAALRWSVSTRGITHIIPLRTAMPMIMGRRICNCLQAIILMQRHRFRPR